MTPFKHFKLGKLLKYLIIYAMFCYKFNSFYDKSKYNNKYIPQIIVCLNLQSNKLSNLDTIQQICFLTFVCILSNQIGKGIVGFKYQNIENGLKSNNCLCVIFTLFR